MSNSFSVFGVSAHPEYFFWGAFVCALLLVVSPLEPTSSGETAAVIGTLQAKENPFTALVLTAKSAYVYDFKTKQALFARNEREIVPLASITKIMTAVTALSLVPETTYVTVTERAIKEEGDSGLRVGERWLLRDLLTFMLVESSNDSAVAVSGAVGGILATSTENPEAGRNIFIGEMNRRAKGLGLSSTYFLNESGLDLDAARAGAYSSASETALLLGYALTQFPAVFRETRWGDLKIQNDNGRSYTAQNTNKDTSNFPLLIASKTGYTDLAGGNLVIAFDAGFNHPIIVAVLGSTAEDRFTDVEKLVWATLDSLSKAN